MEKARMEAFSDGVFAVAITLLALDLAVAGPGHGTLAHQLGERWPSFASYVVSFFVIGIMWVNHHALFKAVAVTDRTILFLNLLLMMFMVAIPFATSTMAAYLKDGGADAHLAAALYSGVLLGAALSFSAIFSWSIRRDKRRHAPLPKEEARRALLRFGSGSLVYLVGILIAFVSAVATVVLIALVAVFYVFEQTPTGNAT